MKKRTLKKYQKGGPVKPIVVTNPNDPKLKAYNDSLDLYNWNNIEAWNKVKNLPFEGIEPFTGSKYTDHYKYDKIKPVGFAKNRYIDDISKGVNYTPLYKKPVQPVEYQKPTKQNISVNSDSNLPKDLQWSLSISSKNNSSQEDLKKSVDIEKKYIGTYVEKINDNSNRINYSYKPKTITKKPEPRVPVAKEEVLPDLGYKTAPLDSIQINGKWFQKGLENPYKESKNNNDLKKDINSVPTMHQGYRNWQKGIKPGLYENGGTMKKRKFKYNPSDIFLPDQIPTYGNGAEIGGAVGTAGGAALNLAVPGLGFIAAPLLGTAGSMIGQYFDDQNTPDKDMIQSNQDVASRVAGINRPTITPGVSTNNTNIYKSGGWIQKAINPAHKGYCTPMSKSTCTGHRRALAMTFKKHHGFHENGGVANAEIEDNELVQVPMGVPTSYGGGTLSQDNNDTYTANGQTHEDGGIQTSLPEGTRIFSDNLKIGKRTIADIVKPITTRIGKVEERGGANPSIAQKNTIDRLKAHQDYYFNTQEAMKEENAARKFMKMYKKGGYVYTDGGVGGNPYDPFNQANEYAQWEQSNKSMLANPNNTNPGVTFPEAKSRFINNTAGVNVLTPPNEVNPSFTPTGYTPNFLPDSVGTNNTNSPTGNPIGLGKNAGLVGAGVSSVLGSFLQNRNINSVGAPKRLSPSTFTAGSRPSTVDYSSDQSNLDRDTLSANAGVLRNTGSTSVAVGNIAKNRASQLMNRSRITQAEQNANAGIMNDYKAREAEAFNKTALNKQGIDQYNNENAFNYNAWKTGQKNKLVSDLTGTAVGLSNLYTQHQNQLDYLDALKKGDVYGTMGRANFIFKNGGKVKRSIKFVKK